MGTIELNEESGTRLAKEVNEDLEFCARQALDFVNMIRIGRGHDPLKALRKGTRVAWDCPVANSIKDTFGALIEVDGVSVNVVDRRSYRAIDKIPMPAHVRRFTRFFDSRLYDDRLLTPTPRPPWSLPDPLAA